MANANETFEVNYDSKQISLNEKFEEFAKSITENKDAINSAKTAITKYLQELNNEKGMDQKRFNRLANGIGDIVVNELNKAKSDLASSSKALEGTKPKNDTAHLQTEQNPAPTTPPIKEAKSDIDPALARSKRFLNGAKNMLFSITGGPVIQDSGK